MKTIVLVAASFLSIAQCVHAQTIDIDSNGMGRALVDWPVEMPIRAGIWVVRDEWKSIQQQWDLKDLKYSPFDVKRTIEGRFDREGASLFLNERIDSNRLSYTLSAKQRVEVTGVYWFLELPVDTFAGGRVVVGERTVELPVDKPAAASLGMARVSTLHIVSRDRKSQIAVKFPADREIRVQDARLFGDNRFQIYTPITQATIPDGWEETFDVSIEAQFPIDDSQVLLTVDAKKRQSPFDGFGGNFVYAIDDPTTNLALERLKLSWARVGVDAAKWEPTNDNDDARITDMESLARNDADRSELRRRFELDQKLFEASKGRLIASLWYPPEWLFDTSLPERNAPGTINRAKWDELAECVTSYLLHLKNRYGVEPALFSFNESDIGIYVLLDGNEMRDMIKLLGKRFSDAGLRTKLLLGDSADLEKGLGQIQATLSDPEAMKCVGALAYHPWSGQGEWWDDWSDAAESHGLPLMVTEMGADPSAWHDGSFNSPLSTMRLARKYVEQLRDARSQVLLEWEWTGDYPITNRSGKDELSLSDRGRFLEQITQTTPTQAHVVALACDSESVSAAMVMSDDAKSAAIHMVNRGGKRRIVVRGLPASLTLATLFVIDPLAGERTPQHLEAKEGGCTIEIPAGAIATLAFPLIE